MSLSRNQRIDIGFFSWLDALTVVGASLVLAALLAWAGRLRRRPRRAVRRDQLPQLDDEPNFVAVGPHDYAEGPQLPAPRSEHSSDLTVTTDSRPR